MKKIDKYLQLSKGVKFNNLSKNKFALVQKGMLTAILPVLSLSSVAAQCNGPQATNSLIDDTGGPLSIDVDGDGDNDLQFYEQPNGNLKVKALGTIRIVTTGGPYPLRSAVNFDPNDPIPGAFPTGMAGFMDYPGGGQWPVSFNGPSATGFMGVKQGANYGFVEITLTSIAGGGNGSQYQISIPEAGIGLSTGTVAGDCPVVLPVEIINFNISAASSEIALSWQTASEIDNAGFEIQRSKNGVDFQTLSFIEGRGSTGDLQSYSFVDDSKLRTNKLYYYRLKQIDFDGNFDYSNVLSTKLIGTEISGVFSPNPISSGQTRLVYSTPENGQLTLRIFDVMGKELLTNNYPVAKGLNTIDLNLDQLKGDLFFVKMEQGSQSTYQKIVSNL